MSIWRLPMSFTRLLRPLFIIALVGVGVMAGSASLPLHAEMSAEQKADVEAVIKNYLLSNPEILRDAMVELDRRDQAKAQAERAQVLADAGPQIFDSPHQTVIGNPDAKITLVEFFDYNCPHCRNIVADIGRLMKTNPDFRVVLKDYPILTPESVDVARVAIALRSQFNADKFWQFHQNLMASRGLVDQARALSVAKDLGADMGQLNKDLKGPEVPATLDEVKKLADALNADGTPTFVIGGSVISGEQDFDQLSALINNMRQCGKASCV
jgi:protein-disulfide isomerase